MHESLQFQSRPAAQQRHHHHRHHHHHASFVINTIKILVSWLQYSLCLRNLTRPVGAETKKYDILYKWRENQYRTTFSIFRCLLFKLCSISAWLESWHSALFNFQTFQDKSLVWKRNRSHRGKEGRTYSPSTWKLSCHVDLSDLSMGPPLRCAIMWLFESRRREDMHQGGECVMKRNWRGGGARVRD